MINKALLDPTSIVVVGASENTEKPGGKVVENLLSGGFKGELYAVNPKPIKIKGVKHFENVKKVPANIDLAILSIPAAFCIEAVQTLAEKNTKAFIIYSAGFGEAGKEGEQRERELLELVENYNLTLIGPNCVGVINENYKGVFTTPVPDYYKNGCELISSSGATAVFIMEAAYFSGLRFSNVYSIGNASQTGAEELLEHMDENFDPNNSPRVKLLYLENIKNPFKFLKHTSSLIRKGCHIAAIKSGYSEAGSRAASSHTGAMATSDALIRALFDKAGVVYCSGREELINVASVWQNKSLNGPNIAIITHAGGSAVMLTDTLSSLGLKIPPIPEKKGKQLLEHLNPGSSVANPIDFLATGNAEQLGKIIDFCNELDEIDGMVVVFGSPGLFQVKDAYEVLDEKIKSCKKPIYPVLPSLLNASTEIQAFLDKGHVNFSDEVVLGNALGRSYNCPAPTFGETVLSEMNYNTIRDIIAQADDGYLDSAKTRKILMASGINMANQAECYHLEDLKSALNNLQFPLVIKVLGPVHKTDVGGVALNIHSEKLLKSEFERMMKIKGANGVLLQEMIAGEELYCGAAKKDSFGHLILCGLGGIFVEILADVSYGLAPLNREEISKMLHSLKGYLILRGYRNRKGVNENAFIDAIMSISSLVYIAPEISELDINPFMGNEKNIVAVDARIRIKK